MTEAEQQHLSKTASMPPGDAVTTLTPPQNVLQGQFELSKSTDQPGIMRNESPFDSSEKILDYEGTQSTQKINLTGAKEQISNGDGVETLKQSYREDEEARLVAEQNEKIFDNVFKQQTKKRKSEIRTMHQQLEEAKQLMHEGETMKQPESLVYKDFGLHNLPAEDRDTQAGSSVAGRMSARKLLKEEMRAMTQTQRQAYIRQTLKSQQACYRSRHSFENRGGAVESANYHEKRLPQRQSLDMKTQKSLQLRQKLRPQTKTTSKSFGLDTGKNLFKKAANATHHFFNARLDQVAGGASSSITQDHFDSEQMVIHDSNLKTTQNLNFENTRPSSDLKNFTKRKSHTSHNVRRVAKIESPTSLRGNTYPNVSFKVKPGEKARRRQMSKMTSGANSSWNTAAAKPAAFHTDKSVEMTYFLEKPHTASAANNPRRSRLTDGYQSSLSQKQVENGLVSGEQPMPLNRFNASYEVSVKPVPIFDSVQQAPVNFPKDLDPTLSIMSSYAHQEKLPTKQQKQTSQSSNQDTIIVRQVQQDISKLKEAFLQEQMDRENENVPINAHEQQLQIQIDFDRACDDLKRLAKCLWRFPEVEIIIEDTVKSLLGIMQKKKRQLSLYINQVQGQFELIGEAVAKQKQFTERIEEHLRRESEFKLKVMEREKSEVLELIKDFEFMPQLSKNKKVLGLDYSNMIKDIAYISHQLENAQINLDALSLYGERETPANLHIIDEVKQEKKTRTRMIQVNTAKRVLHRFYTKKINVDKEIQTDCDEIALLKAHYESTMDALLEREVELSQKIEQLTNKGVIQQNRVDMLEKIRNDLKDNISDLEDKVDALKLMQKTFTEQIKEADRTRMGLEKQLADTNMKLLNSEKTSQQRIVEISKLRDQQKKMEKQIFNLETQKSNANLDAKETSEELITNEHLTEPNADEMIEKKKYHELQVSLKRKDEEMAQLRVQLKKLEAQLKSAKQAKPGVAPKEEEKQPVQPRKPVTQVVTNATASAQKLPSRKPSSIVQKTSRSVSRSTIEVKQQVAEDTSRNKVIQAVQTLGSVASSTTQLVRDGRCPKCNTKIKQEEPINGEEIVNRFQHMVLGRQSTMFKHVLKQVQRRVDNYEHNNPDAIPETNEEDNFLRESGGSSSASYMDRSPGGMRARRLLADSAHNRRSNEFSPSSSLSPPYLMQHRGHSAFDNATQQHRHSLKNQTLPLELNSGKHSHNAGDSPLRNESARQGQLRHEKAKRESEKRKLIDFTKEISQNLNYRFALDQRAVDERVKLVQEKIASRGSPKSQETLLQTMAAQQIYGEEQTKPGSVVTANMPSENSQKFAVGQVSLNDKDTQTEYDAGDVQALFLRKIDQIVGNRIYRAVSPSGKPRLTAANDAIQVEKIFSQKSNYYKTTLYSPGKVHNVPNVEKMRRFEPVRRRIQEMRHSQPSTPRLEDKNLLVADDDEEEEDYTFYKGHQRQESSANPYANQGEGEARHVIKNGGQPGMTVTEFEDQKVLSSYVSELELVDRLEEKAALQRIAAAEKQENEEDV